MFQVVIDVGAGNGVLSYFAAMAGAKKVYALEASGVAPHLQENLAANGVAKTVTVVAGMAEEVTFPTKVAHATPA